MTQIEKGERFRALHEQKSAFIIPNAWDVGSAKLLAHAGFSALASTSAGFAFSMGRADGAVDRATMLAHLTQLAAATDLPVSGDLLNGFGDAPVMAADAIAMAAAAGLVGGSIEDATGVSERPIYLMEQAVERVRAAAEARAKLPFVFTLTARCENYLWGRPDLHDTIRRLQAYQEAGADVLFAPGLTRKEDIAAVLSSVDRPLNAIMGLKGIRLSAAELSEMGVKRISVGSSLARAAYTALLKAAEEMTTKGTFTYSDSATAFDVFNSLFEDRQQTQP